MPVSNLQNHVPVAAVSVLTTSTVLLAAEVGIPGLTAFNISSRDVWVTPGTTTAVAQRGALLKAGGVLKFPHDELPDIGLTAIAVGGTATVVLIRASLDVSVPTPFARVQASVPTAASEGDYIPIAIDTLGQLLLAGYDRALKSMRVTADNLAQDVPARLPGGFTTLTAPGTSEAMPTGSKLFHIVHYTIANIDTSAVLQLEVSNDEGTTFGAVVGPVTKTANGEYKMLYEGPADQMRLNLVSEAGGTAVTVAGHMMSIR